jgi:type VI secretion system protein ImpA
MPDDAWLHAALDGSPAGPNLELDPDFGALERAAQGRPEQQYGDTIIAAADPDWAEVETQAAALLHRTRDLRILVHLAVARLHLGGLPAYAAMLAAIRTVLETAWDTVHPQLDPDDANDPTLRANALLRLAQPSVVLRFLRDLPLASSPRLGRFSWRDIALATGALEAGPDQERPGEPMIRSAFQDTDLGHLAGLRAAALQAADEAAAIVALFEAASGFGTGPDFSGLTRLLSELVRDIDRYVSFPTAPLAVPEPADRPEAAPPTLPAEPASRPAAVTTRTEALRLLDLVCQYYRTYEPSSPLPLLLERARRLADKDFLEILRDLAPDGLPQAQSVAGTREE